MDAADVLGAVEKGRAKSAAYFFCAGREVD
jgi:hypothetical protein